MALGVVTVDADGAVRPTPLGASLLVTAPGSRNEAARRRATCLMAWRTRLTKLLAHESSPAPSAGQLELFGAGRTKALDARPAITLVSCGASACC